MLTYLFFCLILRSSTDCLPEAAMRNIVIIALCLILLLLVCPACTEDMADDIIRRFIPSCTLGEQSEKDQPVEARCSAIAYLSQVTYDEKGVSRQVNANDTPAFVDFIFWRQGDDSSIAATTTKPGELSKDVYVTIHKGGIIIIEAIIRDKKSGNWLAEPSKKRLTWDEAHDNSYWDTKKDILRSNQSFVFYIKLKEIMSSPNP